MELTTAPPTTAILRDLDKSLSDLRARAQKHISKLDDRLREISAEQSELEKQVPREVFVQKILADVREAASADRILIEKKARAAAFLRSHAPMRKRHAVNAAGRPDYVSTDPGPLNLFDYKTPALALIGCLPELFEPAIETWANRMATDLGLQDEGTIEAVREKYDALQEELEALDTEREVARAQLSELVSVATTPYLDEEAFQRMTGKLPPQSQPYPESAESRPVGTYESETGKPLAAIGSDGWREFWSKRRADEATEEAEHERADRV